MLVAFAARDNIQIILKYYRIRLHNHIKIILKFQSNSYLFPTQNSTKLTDFGNKYRRYFAPFFKSWRAENGYKSAVT